jgi:2-desacetyl-2-hydroxyethyl bacteriochlorophyllide A dehydrogenase
MSVDDVTPTPGELVLAPDFSGVCGTDVHVFRQGAMLAGDELPLVLGHEFVGTVVDANGTDVANGTRVAVEPLLPCGTCRQCRHGRPNLCFRWEHLGITRDGCWADYVSVPAERVTRLPDAVSSLDAALAEPLACAVNFVLHRGALSAGESILVLGAGPIGVLCAAVAKGAGAGLIVVSEPLDSRRARAAEAGADLTVDPTADDLPAVVDELTRGLGFDVIVEVTGSPRAIAQAVDLAAPGSRLVLAGLGSGAPVPVDTNAIARKELDIRGGFASRWAMATGLSLLADGRLSTRGLVTSVRDWADAPSAMDDLSNDPETCKILFASHSSSTQGDN